KKKIAQRNKEKVVLLWAYYRDNDGGVGSERDGTQINKASNAPLFIVHDVGLGHGAVGGVIQSGYRQGDEAARLLEQVLVHPQEPLPPVVNGESEIKLDYHPVVRWGLGAEQGTSAVFFQ
ncbi:hypothetical protein UF05_08940, partial [Vibrio sp. S457-15]